MFMLLGAITALDLRKSDNEMIFGGLRRMCVGGGKNKGKLGIMREELNVSRSFSLFCISIVLYYACMAAYKLGPLYCHFQMVSLIPLLLAIYFFFIFCSCEKMIKVFDKALSGNVVYFISSLTLEIYLVQYALFTDRMNFMFPLNIPVMYLMIFGVAYVLKVLAQGFSQIFGKEDMVVKKLFKV